MLARLVVDARARRGVADVESALATVDRDACIIEARRVTRARANVTTRRARARDLDGSPARARAIAMCLSS